MLTIFAVYVALDFFFLSFFFSFPEINTQNMCKKRNFEIPSLLVLVLRQRERCTYRESGDFTLAEDHHVYDFWRNVAFKCECMCLYVALKAHHNLIILTLV
jgi:hypothetical protein